jgi:hypothetical protein
MEKHGVPVTLRSYVQLNWMGDMTVSRAIRDAEALDQIPPELVGLHEAERRERRNVRRRAKRAGRPGSA